MEEKERFIADLYAAAVKVSEETGMSWELILAQAAHETGWGKKVLPGTNNIFNIKASAGWQGDIKTFNVWERVDGKTIWVDQPFRVYETLEDAMTDRVRFLRDNPRYSKAGLFDTGTLGDLAKEAAALQKAGYATDENYAELLVDVFEGRTMRRAVAMATLGTDHDSSRLRREHDDVQRLQTKLNRLGFTDADGHPLVTDGDYGHRTRLAVEDFQRRYDLVADGIAGPLTMATLQHAIETELRSIGQPDAPYLRSEQSTESLSAYRTLSPEPVASPVMPVLRLDDPAHPDNGLYQEAQAYVHDLDRQYAKEPDQYSDNLSAALVVAARSEGLCRIDGIELTKNASHLSAVQSSLGEPDKRAEVPIMASLNLPMERSSDRWPDAMQAYEKLEEASREQVRVQPIAAMPEVSTNRYADPVAAGHGRKDPRHPESANHELYNELQRRVPDASEDRLLQFTAACHESQITADNLVEARLDEDKGTLTFIGTGPLTRPARIDLDSAPPYPEQAIAQIQQNDQQQAQVMEEVRMQQAQMSVGHSR